MFEIGGTEVEVILRIMVANVLNNFPEPLLIPWQFTVFNILTQKVAQDSSKIFVSWKGQEASGVGEHSDKATQET